MNVIGHALPEDEYAVVLAEAPVNPVKPGEVNDYFVNEQILLWGEDNFGACLTILVRHTSGR